MCVRWQNGVLLILPGLELLRQLWLGPARWRRWVAQGALLLAGALIGAFPQMAAWKSLFDMWVLPYPPHGTDFVRLDHPFVLQTLFSSRHGLLSWTPIFWAGYLGFLPLLRRHARLALPLIVPLVLMTYVNMCSGDWWAGGSFSNRRFDSLLPILACGFAARSTSCDASSSADLRLCWCVALVIFVAWNTTLAEQMRRGIIPRDDTVPFPRLVEQSAGILSGAIGQPADLARELAVRLAPGRSPVQYDRLVGRYLFYRQNNMRGHVEMGAAGDEVMLGEGWGPVETYAGVGVRRTQGPARVFAPLDVPQELEIRVRAAAVGGPLLVAVHVNGREAGSFQAEPTLGEHAVHAPEGFWRRELNEVVIEPSTGELLVDAVIFRQRGRRRW